jgi:hypothetical protein
LAILCEFKRTFFAGAEWGLGGQLRKNWFDLVGFGLISSSMAGMTRKKIASTSVNKRQQASTSVNKRQQASTSVNKRQQASTSVNNRQRGLGVGQKPAVRVWLMARVSAFHLHVKDPPTI